VKLKVVKKAVRSCSFGVFSAQHEARDSVRVGVKHNISSYQQYVVIASCSSSSFLQQPLLGFRSAFAVSEGAERSQVAVFPDPTCSTHSNSKALHHISSLCIRGLRMACTGQAASRFGAPYAALNKVGRSKRGHLDSPGCLFLPTGGNHEGTTSMLSARRRDRKHKHPNAEARLPYSPQFGRQCPQQLRATPSPQSRGAGAGRRCRGGVGGVGGVGRPPAGPDKMCRDQVNVPLEIVSPEDSQAERVKVTLLGAKGSQQVIEVPTDVYILDSAIENNIDLPWSCRGGICG
jgi:hypothetical protein